MPSIRVFTKPIETFYPAGLAWAIHAALAYGGAEHPLNHGHALLYASAEIDGNDQLVPRFLQNPRIEHSPAEQQYIITADLVDASGSKLGIAAWRTGDFRCFQPCEPGQGCSCTADIADDEAPSLLNNWDLRCQSASVPESLRLDELAEARAVVGYSDGSRHEKPVDWNLAGIDLTRPGRYPLTGRICQTALPFPLAEHTGDPVLLHWENHWYFFSTNDANGNIGLTIRRAKTVEGLFAPGYEEARILDRDEEHGFIQTFWAPETHVIGGRLCVLFAVSGVQWGPQCHVMRLKEGGDPFRASDWELPRPVLRADGAPLFAGQLNIDMTWLNTSGGQYYVWSTRRDCMGPNDSGSMLAIARMNPDDPGTVTSEPIVLNRPLLGFENVSGTINSEGPYALVRNDHVYLFFSGGDAGGYTYCLGLLEADGSNDLTDLSIWRKRPYPVLHFNSVEGIYGPGHHSFFEWNGETYIAHHAVTALDKRIRSTAIRRVHFDAQGCPRLDLSSEHDLDSAVALVTTTLMID